jgi:hypothetical protein
MTDQPNSNDDLHWLAFRYVCGEMAAGEEDAFERRLAADQLAREAVAEAVEIHEGIRLVSRRRRRFAHRPLVAWLAAAACLLLALGLMWMASGKFQDHAVPSGNESARSDGPKESPAEVALTWAEMQGQPRDEEVAAETFQPEPGLDGALPVEDILGDEKGVPQWMLIAFSPEAEPMKGNR